MLHLPNIWYLFHLWTRDKCVLCLLSCHYPMPVLCPNVCLVWMGQTLNMILLVNTVVSPRNVIKLQNCSFLYGMTPQKVCQNYLGTNSKFKAAQKLTPSQFCSKNALNEAIFLKNGNFGKHVIVVSFLSCFFVQDSDFILMVYNGQIKMQCWHHFKFFYVSLWLSNSGQ